MAGTAFVLHRFPTSIVDRLKTTLAGLIGGMFASVRRVVQRRELADLNDRQLRDAGIDPFFFRLGIALFHAQG